jgi:5-methylcytosine-specific restriction endonuclease McrA
MRTLILNATFEPLCVVSARRAVLLEMDDKVEVIEHGDPDRVFHSQYLDFHVPSVLRLKRYVKVPRNRSIPLNTRTVLARDRHKCAYCGEKATTMDHVDPKKNLGPHLWENVVAACQKCNNKKGHKSLDEMGWTLLIEPSRPIGAKASIVAFGGVIEEPWKQYLGLDLAA